MGGKWGWACKRSQRLSPHTDLEMYPPTDDPAVLAIMSRIIHPSCILLPRGTRVCYVRIDHGNQLFGELLPAFSAYGAPRDALVANFGQVSVLCAADVGWGCMA